MRAPGEIENGVLYGRDGELFLAHGGHHVIDIVTGKRRVSAETFAAFKANIVSRARYARQSKSCYAHVIFPDKQTILRDQFPINTSVCLGEAHLKSSPELAAHIFYPTDLLRKGGRSSFMKTDTHMTDRGTIQVVTSLVETLSNENQSEHLQELLGRITVEREHVGDLGTKLKPPSSSKEQFLAIDWEFRRFENGIRGGNNGIVDIYFSPNALYPQRVLWFGDSFGREAVKVLSYYYQEIAFLRTPFFHSEIFDQIRPDILITDNVERYLASSQPDDVRPSFFMYPYLNELDYRPTKEFAEAFSAILGSQRPIYTAFTRSVCPPSQQSNMTQQSELAPNLPQPVMGRMISAPAEVGAAHLEHQRAAATAATSEVLGLSEESNSLANKMGVVADIHKKDFIFKFVSRKWKSEQERAVANYYQLGNYSAKLAHEILQEVRKVREVLKDKWTPDRVLDFASGYGCVARHLSGVLPDSLISTCDIHSEAVEFNAKLLGLASAVSSSIPEQLALPPQDVILALSFFSHMPRTTWIRWLQALAATLAPGGVLVFTANGYVTDKLGNVRVEVTDDGFGFRPESEQGDLDANEYGITISYPNWVFRALGQCPGLRLVRFQEGLWWAVQDTYVCIRSI